MGKLGLEKQVRFSEVHIYSNNFRSSYCFSRIPTDSCMDAKLFENAAKMHKGGSDPSGTLLTNIEGAGEEGRKSTDTIASKLVTKPFTYFLVLSISSQTIIDSIVIAIDAFIADVDKAFQELPPDMQQVLKKFGAAAIDPNLEKRAIHLLLESTLIPYLQ